MELKKLHECSLPTQAVEKEPAEFLTAKSAHLGAGNTSVRAQLVFHLRGCKFLAFLFRFPLHLCQLIVRVSVLLARRKTKYKFTAQKQEQIKVIQKYLQFHNSGITEALRASNNENIKKVKRDKYNRQSKPLSNHKAAGREFHPFGFSERKTLITHWCSSCC